MYFATSQRTAAICVAQGSMNALSIGKQKHAEILWLLCRTNPPIMPYLGNPKYSPLLPPLGIPAHMSRARVILTGTMLQSVFTSIVVNIAGITIVIIYHEMQLEVLLPGGLQGWSEARGWQIEGHGWYIYCRSVMGSCMRPGLQVGNSDFYDQRMCEVRTVLNELPKWKYPPVN